MIVDQESLRLLGTNALFKGISKNILKPYLKPKNFFEVKEGEILYVCGDETSDIFLIVEGEVKIKFSCNGESNVKHKYLSDFFGEVEILNSSERTSSAIANTDCVLFKFSSSELKQLSSSNKEMVDNLNCNDKNQSSSSQKIETPEYQPPTSSNEKSGNDLPEDVDDDVDWTLAET